MRLIQLIFLTFVFITSTPLFSQDTVSVYFEFGSSKILDKQFEVLNSIPTRYDLSALDSIHFVGMADSIGSSKANKKLSEKRAKNIKKHIQELLHSEVVIRVLALGERRNKIEEQNRRVDIILYFKPVQIDDFVEVDTVHKTNEDRELCYNIDYELLHRSHLRTITKRRKEFIIIETNVPELKKKKEHYYGLTNKAGKFFAQPIKWKNRRTGSLWWSKKRTMTTIPKKSFDQYKVFKIKDLPCDSCHENFSLKPTIEKEDTCIQVDRFLMQNVQLKAKLLNNKVLKVRVPKEYIDINSKYFIGCNLNSKIQWKNKKGRRKKHYYYSILPRQFDHLANITRVMSCCRANPEPSACNKTIIKFRELHHPDRSLVLHGEVGNNFQQSTHTPYAVLGISKEGYTSRMSINAGTDINRNLYSSLRYQQYFLSFSFNTLNPLSKWQSPSNFGSIYQYARLYVGTDLNLRLTERNVLEQNIHLGIAAVNTKRNALIPRIFIHYGLGIDYLAGNRKAAYSIAQLGLNIKIKRLKNKLN